MKTSKVTKERKKLRNKYINTRCTDKEYEEIKEKASNAGLSSSAYLRNLGVNYPLKSVVDQRALSELVKCKADLGRLGGLFKLWLENENGTWGDLGDRRYEDISDLVDDLIAKEDELLQIARKLLD
ncbi:MAG: DNA transfer system protein TraJ [uncultured Sulfurovum sp.]|uniref:DNA transfer system protein TraJ n=1 Tax=uncultured Sulfurovum sp. TaxID=269237 RepID=A0A6S6S0A4_9BACT|nr:MAG: DNA transfer system protein TraJ [uncultured Sulfurovum sp.]